MLGTYPVNPLHWPAPPPPHTHTLVMVWVALTIPDSVDEWKYAVQAKAFSPLPKEFNLYNVYNPDVLGRSKDYYRP